MEASWTLVVYENMPSAARRKNPGCGYIFSIFFNMKGMEITQCRATTDFSM